MPIFTPDERAGLRAALLERAASDARITGSALTGSSAVGHEDRWSDIDLAFGIADGSAISSVIEDWTALMYASYAAVHHMDVKAGAWIYRVFLLSNTLQVDLAFVNSSDFRALGPHFRLLSGQAGEPQDIPPPAAGDLIGYGWLYALHARSCIARGKLWQAEYMISAIRDSALALACLRRGFPAVHGRGFDLLPESILAEFTACLVRSPDRIELLRALRIGGEVFLRQIKDVDRALAERLQNVVTEMIQSSSEPPRSSVED